MGRSKRRRRRSKSCEGKQEEELEGGIGEAKGRGNHGKVRE